MNQSNQERLVLLVHCLGDGTPRSHDAWQVVELHSRGNVDLLDVLKHCLAESAHVGRSVAVWDVLDWKVDLSVMAVLGVVLVVLGNVVIDLDPQSLPSLIRPTSRNILYCVPTSTEHQGGKVETECILETPRMALDTHVEPAQLVPAQAVSS